MTLIIALAVVCVIGASIADTAEILSDTVFTMDNVTLNANKHVTFQMGTNVAQSEIYIRSVYLYQQSTNGTWMYVRRLPAPSRV